MCWSATGTAVGYQDLPVDEYAGVRTEGVFQRGFSCTLTPSLGAFSRSWANIECIHTSLSCAAMS